MSTKTLKTNDLIVAELYDLTNNRLWYKNYDWKLYDYNLNRLYDVAITDIEKWLSITPENFKPNIHKYRVELKFLVKDKST